MFISIVNTVSWVARLLKYSGVKYVLLRLKFILLLIIFFWTALGVITFPITYFMHVELRTYNNINYLFAVH